VFESERIILGRTKLPYRLQNADEEIRIRNTGSKWPWFILYISLVEIVIMVYAIIYNKGFESLSTNIWAGPSRDTLIQLGAKDVALILQKGQFWRFLSAVFLHLGVFHLLINLFVQLVMGAFMEQIFNSWRIALVYLLSGVGGYLLSAIFLPNQLAAGASSAIFGLLSIYIVDLIANWKFYAHPYRELAKWTFSTVLSIALGKPCSLTTFC